MKRTNRLWLLALGVVLTLFALAAGCSSSPVLTSIEVTPAVATLDKGATKAFTATGKYDDETTKDITSDVAWSTSSSDVVVVDDKGVATGVAKGEATISATLTDGGEKITGGAAVTITDAADLVKIEVTPAAPTIAAGTMLQLVATGTYSDNSTQDLTKAAVWTSSDDAVATFSSEKGVEGVLTAAGAGSATLTATLKGKTGSVTLKVTGETLQAIEVSSPDPLVAKGMQEQFTATGVFSDGSKQDMSLQVTWASSDPAVTISNTPGTKGLATAVEEGVVTITATAMGVTGSMSFQVTAATLSQIDVTPFDPTIAKGTQIAFSATGVLSDNTVVNLTPFVAWASSDEAVATVSKSHFSQGVVTGIGVGKADITATYKGKIGSSSLDVTAATLTKIDLVPLDTSIAKGTYLKMVAIGTFSDATAQDLTQFATWGTSNANVATVSNAPWEHGLVTGLNIGMTTITADVNGKSDSTTLYVSQATLDTVYVTPANASIAKGTSIQLTATGIYSDKTTQDLTQYATWTSSDDIVSISNGVGFQGVARGLDVGAVTIKAAFGAVNGATTLTVTTATLVSIDLTPPNPIIAKGTSVQLTATGLYTDESTQDLTHWVAWTSSDASVAVSNDFVSHGLATGMVQGSATITASFMGLKSGSTAVTVTAATLSSLDVVPKAPIIAKGTSVALAVVGTYSDNSKQNLSEVAIWSSSDASVAVSNVTGSHGVATGIAEGAATITASFNGKTATTTVTVTAATLTSLAMTPQNPSIAKGTALWFTATGTYSDNSTQDLTAVTTWFTSDVTKALISNAYGSRGLATGVSPGAVTITAAFGGKSATTTLTVTAATLVTIEVMPVVATVSKNATQQFWATGTYTDNTVQDISTLVTWLSSDGTRAIISNAYGSKGLATGVGLGQATISAVLSGKAGTSTLTVVP